MFKLRDKTLADSIISQLKTIRKSYTFMHVCGTHQDTLIKHGLDALFSQVGITVIPGPGCPVCVTSPKEIEEVLLLAQKGKTIATFGDMIRVPGTTTSLRHVQAEGCDIQTVYSIEDAVDYAVKHPKKDVVFMAVGFETTAPTTAITLQNNPPDNFSILCCHRTMPHALKAILDMGERKIDGFIQPGHVSTIIGTHPYDFISTQYHVPQVIAGFEPLDILMAVWFLVKQHQKDTTELINEYRRVVKTEGNPTALTALKDVFQDCDIKWRGFPIIPQSGLTLSKKYDQYDARIRYHDILKELEKKTFSEPPGCRCGELLRGLLTPQDCPLFSKQCTPESPIGPCMVSAEGSCHIAHRYHKK